MAKYLKKRKAGLYQSELAAVEPYLALAAGVIHQAMRDMRNEDPFIAVDALGFFISEACRELLETNLPFIQADSDRLFRAAITGQREKLMLTGLEGKDHAQGAPGTYRTAAG